MLQVSNNNHRKEEEDVSFRSIIIQRRGCRSSCFNDPVHGSCITNEYVCILYSYKRILLFYFILFYSNLFDLEVIIATRRKVSKTSPPTVESVPACTCLYKYFYTKSRNSTLKPFVLPDNFYQQSLCTHPTNLVVFLFELKCWIIQLVLMLQLYLFVNCYLAAFV